MPVDSTHLRDKAAAGAGGASAMLAEVSGATAKAAQDTPRRPARDVQVGISGTRLSGGRVWDYEHNSSLSGRDWAAECERMLREDAQVASCARAIVDTLASAKWRFEQAPATGDPLLDEQAKRATDYANEAFGLAGHVGRLRGGFEQFVRVAVQYLLVGFRYLEEVYEVRDGFVWVSRFADCEPSAHKAWVPDEAGELAFVEQYAVGYSQQPKPIPANKLVLLTLDRTGQNYEGRGLLRSAHFPFRIKHHALDMLAIGLERWALPTPVVTVDRRALIESGLPEEKVKALHEEAEANAKDYVSHELGYLSATAGITFTTYGGDAFDPSKIDGVVALCDRQIAQAFLLGFLQLGVSDTGSRSVGEVQESFFGRAAVNFLDHIAAVIGGPAGPGTGTLGRLMAWNFPALPAKAFPRLRHEGLDESPMLDHLSSFGFNVQAGLLTPTNELENGILASLGVPPLRPEYERTPQERTAPAAPGGPLGALMAERMRQTRKT